MQLHRLTHFLFLAIALPFAASADEGALEINQACAEGNGCFAGDDPGYPVEITGSGSYRLTTSLSVPADTAGITVGADHVKINMGGFSIQGQGSCTDTPVTSCSGGGGFASNGIVSGQEAAGVTVENGSVVGMGNHGISLGTGAHVEDVYVEENGNIGVVTRVSGSIANVTARRNQLDGVRARNNSTVTQSRGLGNGNFGIGVTQASVVTESAAQNNGAGGIKANYGTIVRDSSVMDNSGPGITIFASATPNATVIVDNVIKDNIGLGVECDGSGASALKGNALTGNNSGGDQFSSTCLETGENACGFDLNCP